MTFYVRKPGSVIVTGGRGVMIIDGGRVHTLDDVGQRQLSAVVARTCKPVSHEELGDEIDEAALKLLTELGLLVSGSEESVRAVLAEASGPQSTPIAEHLVLGITGAIGAAEMVGVVRQLRRRHFRHVDVMLTDRATCLLNPAAFEHFGIPVWTDEFQIRGDVRVPHVHLARIADLVLIMPASAHTLHKLASAACSDLVSLVVTATRAPVVIVPSMNEEMWRNRAVQDNVERLRQCGYCIVEPSYGIEVASGLDAEPAVGGAGVSGQNLALLLAAVVGSRTSER